MDQEQNKHRLYIFMVALFAVQAIMFSADNFKYKQIQVIENVRINKIQEAISSIPLDAKAVSVYDIDTSEEIYGLNQNEPLPLASLTKTMTVLTALADNAPGSLITISQNALNQEGIYGFLLGEQWRIEDLARVTLIGSINDGAYALIENDPNALLKMNERAKRIGMKNTEFSNPTGLDYNSVISGSITQASAYSSAFDANIMAAYAIKAKPEIFSVTAWPVIDLKSESGIHHNFKNTNIIAGSIPNLIFSKTGFTGSAGGNLTIIFRNREGHKIAITILGSTATGRFSDMEKLINTL